jgi:K+-sensing histidine kinase KdpD
MIDITDDGPGIPVEAREKVFERFYRMNGARSRSDGGVRLGLSIARWSVEANGGRIAFLDCEEGGSCCRIALPMSRTPSG